MNENYNDEICEKDFKVAGYLKTKEDVVCNLLKVAGCFNVKGSIKSNHVKCSGLLRVSEDILASELKCAGTIIINNKIKAQNINIAGYLRANEVEAENCEMAGKIKIAENINCETLSFDISGNSFVNEIEACNILIKKKNRKRKYLITNSITADMVDVIHLKCKKISGDKVVIGPKCVVDYVEYSTSLEVHSSSKVKKAIKM